MNNNLIYLDKKILQKDMRVRLPESIKENLGVREGQALYIFLDVGSNSIVITTQQNGSGE